MKIERIERSIYRCVVRRPGFPEYRSIRDQDLRTEDSAGSDDLVALDPHRPGRVAYLPQLRCRGERLARDLRPRKSHPDHNRELVETRQMEETDSA